MTALLECIDHNNWVKCMALWGEPGAMIDVCVHAYTHH